MRIVGLCFFIGILSFTACQKEEPVPAVVYDTYQPLTVGSYWIYKHYTVDSNGIENSLNKQDTFRITGDSIIGNYTYKMQEGIVFPFSPINTYGFLGFIRDSLHYLVTPSGEKLFSSQEIGTIIREHIVYLSGHMDTFRFIVEAPTVPVVVPTGTYTCLDLQRYYSSSDSLTASFSQGRIEHQYYAKDIGKVLHQYPVASPPLIFYERRLVEYYIAPE